MFFSKMRLFYFMLSLKIHPHSIQHSGVNSLTWRAIIQAHMKRAPGFEASCRSGQTVSLHCYLMHCAPEKTFPVSLHCERSIGYIFLTVTTPPKWLVSLLEFEPFILRIFRKSGRAAPLKPCSMGFKEIHIGLHPGRETFFFFFHINELQVAIH